MSSIHFSIFANKRFYSLNAIMTANKKEMQNQSVKDMECKAFKLQYLEIKDSYRCKKSNYLISLFDFHILKCLNFGTFISCLRQNSQEKRTKIIKRHFLLLSF